MHSVCLDSLLWISPAPRRVLSPPWGSDDFHVLHLAVVSQPSLYSLFSSSSFPGWPLLSLPLQTFLPDFKGSHPPGPCVLPAVPS